jgi:hypothetical protein
VVRDVNHQIGIRTRHIELVTMNSQAQTLGPGAHSHPGHTRPARDHKSIEEAIPFGAKFHRPCAPFVVFLKE